MPNKSIAAFGGGHGLASLLEGFRNKGTFVNAIVSMFDSGGSTGKLREMGYPPFGDLRECLLALAPYKDVPLARMMAYRFPADSHLQGHSLGNLMMAALYTELGQDIEKVISKLSQGLAIDSGKVIPCSLEDAVLVAELANGGTIWGETLIDKRIVTKPAITSVSLDKRRIASPAAVKACMDASAIVIGPGDLYTSVIPSLLPEGFGRVIQASRAKVIYICNLMTKAGETYGYKAEDFVQAVNNYIAPAQVTHVVINDPTTIGAAIELEYAKENAFPVKLGGKEGAVLIDRLHNGEVPLRHDSERLYRAIMGVL